LDWDFVVCLSIWVGEGGYDETMEQWNDEAKVFFLPLVIYKAGNCV
jgi:hypothetical protein